MFQLALAAVLQLSLAIAVEAAPVRIQADAWQYGTGGGIAGVIVLFLDIIAWVEIFKSNRPPINKLIWALVVFFFPIIGMLIYYLFSNRKAHNTYEPIGE